MASPEQTRPVAEAAALTPAQQRVIDLLGRGTDRVEVPVEVVDALRAQLEDELADVADVLDDAPLWVSKHALATVHACEAHYLAGLDEPFAWTVANARGTVAHRAIERLVHWQGEPAPAELVDETIARMTDEHDRGGIGGFLAGLDDYDRAELRGLAVDRVTAFVEGFPRPKATWVPRTEASSRVELADGAVVLSGKADLCLGRPGAKVIIDFKTGVERHQHREDLRFYALLETLKLGVAPRKIASYYLDTAMPHPEDVSEGTLRAAARRTIDGVHRIVDVRTAAREPARVAGPQCGWCPLLASCDVGLASRAAFDG